MTAVLAAHRLAHPARPARRRADAATYRRRRLTAVAVIAGALAVPWVLVSGSPLGPGGVPAAATGAQPASARADVVAQPGDTLWSIAHTHRGDVDHAAYLEALVRLNGGASIQAGQRIVLP